MIDVKNIVMEAYKEIIMNTHLNITPELSNSVGRESGLDSLGLVNFIVEIEDRLDISLDSVLATIRQSTTINDIVNVIEDLLNTKVN